MALMQRLPRWAFPLVTALVVIALVLFLFPGRLDPSGTAAGEHATAAPTTSVERARELEAPAPPARAESAASEPAERVPASASGLRGRVVDANGAPFAGAWLWIGEARELPLPRFEFTGADGRFALERAPGPVVLSARADASRVLRRAIDVPRAGWLELGDLALDRGLALRGRVVDHHGTPLEHVEVRAHRTGSANGGIEGFVQGHRVLLDQSAATTDANGRFELAGLEPEAYDVAPEGARRDGRHFEPDHLSARLPGTEELEFRLVPDLVVRGRVLDASTGAPIARFLLDGEPVEAADGRFECVPRVRYGFSIEARGYRDWSCDETRLHDLARAGDCVVRLDPAPDVGTLALRVRDPAGAPIADASVRATSPERIDERTNAAGELVVEKLSTRAFELEVRAPGWTDARVPIQLEPGARLERTVVLRRSQAVAITILDPLGLVATRASIRVESRGAANQPYHWRYARRQGTTIWVEDVPLWTEDDFELALTDAEGRIEGLAPGRYVLHARHPGEEERAVPFEVDAEAPRELRVRFDEPAPR